MGVSNSEFRPFKLEKVERVNHNVSLFRFKLSSSDETAGLPVASCVMFKYGQTVRPYTPTSKTKEKGYVDFVVKDYPEGNMSRHVHSLKVGDTLEMKGPFVKWDWEKNPVHHVGMIAGGTGITPMLQILRSVFDEQSTDKKSQFTLVYANTTEQDILFKQELDGYARQFPDRFRVFYVLEKPDDTFNGLKGYVTRDLIKQVMPQPSTDDAVVFVCGPPPMMEAISGDKAPDKSQGVLNGFLKDLGYLPKRVYKL